MRKEAEGVKAQSCWSCLAAIETGWRLLETGTSERHQAEKEIETVLDSITEPLNPAMPKALGLVSFSVNIFLLASVGLSLVF